MKTRKLKKELFHRMLCILLCIILFTESVPISSAAQTAAFAAQKKFIKVESEIFAPSAKEKTTISFNLEGKKKAVKIYVKDGKRIIANLVTNKEYEGNYTVHQLVWDGKDDKGNYVKNGTYKIVVEPLGKYSKFKSIANVCVVGDSTKSIDIAPNRTGSVFQVYGSGGKKQGIKKVTISVKKDGTSIDSIKAIVGENLWYAKLPMSSYQFYELSAKAEGSSETKTSSISAVVHNFRVTDRLSYLASAYYGDSAKDAQIQKDNGLEDGITNSGALIGSNVLMINPQSSIQQEVKANHTKVNQHLGIIDQLQRVTSLHPSSLTMGNNFYVNDDLVIEGSTPLIFNRSYNSMAQSLHEFGMNWTHSYTYYLQEFGNTAAIRFGDGHIEYYTKQTDGSYNKPDGMARKLTVNADGSYQLMVDGIYVYTFGKDGMLQEIRDLNGNATTFSYVDGVLSKVENRSGYLCFLYHKDGSLQSVIDHNGRAVSYTYTNGLLTGFTDVEGAQTTYAYDSKNRLNQVVSPEKVVLAAVSYDAFDRVTEKIVRGSKYQYRYDDKERRITCIEPNGNTIKFQYTADYRIASEEDADGITTYSYKNKSKAAQPKENVRNWKGEISQKSKQRKPAVTTASAKKESAAVFSLSDEESQDKSAASNLLALKTLNISACTGDQKFNTIYPQFQLINTSGEEIALSDVTMRYYYTIDGEKEQAFQSDWSSIGANNVTGKFVKLAYPVKGADYYLEVGFTRAAGNLTDSVDLHTRIVKTDWSDYIPGDDYSQNTAATLSYFDQVDVFYKGELVWGKGSINGEEGENPPTDPEEPPVTPPVDPEDPPEDNEEEEEILPAGIDRLKLQLYNRENAESFSGTIHPMMKLVNLGETMIPLHKVTIRYYYTKDNDKPQTFVCDWSDVGTEYVTGTFHAMEEPMDGADTYLEIGFQEEAGFLGIASEVAIHSRMHKEDWSPYDLTNDHSIRPGSDYADWNRVDVFLDGKKIWGEELDPEIGESLEVEHMDYADTTYTPVRVEMYNRNRESKSNTISPAFRIYNTQDEPIRLSDVTLNYFYTADHNREQTFEVDWADIGGTFGSSLRNGDVTCQFTKIDANNLATACIAEIGFTNKNVWIKPGEFLELKVRIYRTNWSKYLQTNDFSFHPESEDYTEWEKLAVFVDNRWAYGSIPLSHADWMDPYPNEENDITYPSESKESYGTSKDKEGNTTDYTYDSNGNITAVTDALGNTTTYHYNAWNQMTKVVNALGDTILLTYDKTGNLTKTTDAEGFVTTYAYDDNGNLTKITKADSSTETRTYDKKGNLKRTTDESGGTIQYTYDAWNQVISETDSKGGVRSYEYAANGSLLKATDALGNTMETSYNKEGEVTRETDALGHTTIYQYDTVTGELIETINALSGKESYTYDEMGNLAAVTAPDGGITTYQYDLSGRLARETDANGAITQYAYDKNGNLTKETDALGRSTVYSYDTCGQVISVTDAEQNTIQYTYDALGRKIKEILPSKETIQYTYDKRGNIIKQTDALRNVTQYTYNEVGQLVNTKDVLGNITTYEYDASGRKIKETDALSHTHVSTYDTNGLLTAETDANGNTIRYGYDKEYQMLWQEDANQNRTAYVYDAVGNVTSVTDALGRETTYAYDALGNQISTTHPGGTRLTAQYNASGQLIQETDARGNKSMYAYDFLGNVVQRTDAKGGITRTTYDLASQRVTEEDALGNHSSYQYDKLGNLIVKQDAVGNPTTYTYDASSRLTKVTDAMGNRTTYEYDLAGQLLSETREDRQSKERQTLRYAYDKKGQLLQEIDQMGGITAYQYDAAGRITDVVEKDRTATNYRYDAAGNLEKMTYADGRSVTYHYTKTNQIKTREDWLGITRYAYDAIGQTKSVTNPDGQTIAYTFTNLGQKESITYPGKEKVSYAYDAMGNVAKVTDTSGGITRYTYDEKNQMATKELPNGVKSTYTYDDNGQLIQREERNPSNQTAFTYAYDANGNRTKETKTSSGSKKTTSYTYDAFNQLTKVTEGGTSRSYTYDAYGNRLRKEETGNDTIEYRYNALNQLQEKKQGEKQTTYAYDKRGNVWEVNQSGAEKWSYTFDAANQLTEVVKKKEGEDKVTTKYRYDGEKNRIGKTIESNGTIKGDFAYVADPESPNGNCIVKIDQRSKKTSVITFGARDQVLSETKDGNIRYFETDEKNSVGAVFDEAGQILETLLYDEFGVLIQSEAGKIEDSTFSYTGYEYEESTGLYYAKARYYQAEDGRFLSEDAYHGNTSEEGNWNWYAYVKNNPIRYWDPSGNFPLLIFGLTVSVAVIKHILLAAGTFVISIIVLEAGRYISKELRVKDLGTKKGIALLKKAKQIVVGNVTYTAKQFMKLMSKEGQSKKKTKGKGQANSVAVGVSGNTITVGNNKYNCDTKAEEIALSMSRNGHKYYPALRTSKQIFVAPIAISRGEALAIMTLNNDRAGVFAVSNKYAKGLCISLGGAEGPEGESRSGYWMHYHGKACRKAHCWFIGN